MHIYGVMLQMSGLRSDETIHSREAWQVGDVAFWQITLNTCFLCGITAHIVLRLSYDVDCVILRFTVLEELRLLTDGLFFCRIHERDQQKHIDIHTDSQITLLRL